MRSAAARKGQKPARHVAIGIIGAGNMATALVRGLLQAGLYTAREILMSDIDPAKRHAARRRFGVAATADNRALVRASRAVLLAVKPQGIDAVLDEIRPEITPRHCVLSIAAGVPTSRIEAHLGVAARVVRIMPNTPAQVGHGASVIVRGRHATAADERLALRMFRAVGLAIAVGDESLLDPVTGLSGSGPAYVYSFAEGLARGGTAAGLPPDLAHKLAVQTILGAAVLLAQSSQSPQDLRTAVTSPGGTTLAGLAELERRNFVEAVVAAVVAAAERSRELGRT